MSGQMWKEVFGKDREAFENKQKQQKGEIHMKRITLQVELTPDVFGNYFWKVIDLNTHGLALGSGYAKSHEVATQQALNASKRFL